MDSWRTTVSICPFRKLTLSFYSHHLAFGLSIFTVEDRAACSSPLGANIGVDSRRDFSLLADASDAGEGVAWCGVVRWGWGVREILETRFLQSNDTLGEASVGHRSVAARDIIIFKLYMVQSRCCNRTLAAIRLGLFCRSPDPLLRCSLAVTIVSAQCSLHVLGRCPIESPHELLSLLTLRSPMT